MCQPTLGGPVNNGLSQEQGGREGGGERDWSVHHLEHSDNPSSASDLIGSRPASITAVVGGTQTLHSCCLRCGSVRHSRAGARQVQQRQAASVTAGPRLSPVREPDSRSSQSRQLSPQEVSTSPPVRQDPRSRSVSKRRHKSPGVVKSLVCVKPSST
ncbi:unnamed protein product [Pleuronectes platessa]|uniref:Uncharacterized protein n=1 Tax=Pleuronectes platessa TaxID=8262 RepID=A0A9N7TWT9_PLEPL|nr:unnamed protein product [Pleuronectes platessa]